MAGRDERLDDRDYQRLLEFRTGLRTYLKWTHDRAVKEGMAPAQHQLLLAVRGHHDHERGPTIGEVAKRLLVKPHTAAELVSRTAKAGLIDRVPDDQDRRIVRLRLTEIGEQKLESITGPALEEMRRLRPALQAIWESLD